MYLRLVLLLLAFVVELQVADADCGIKYCVDNKDCDIEFIDCPHKGKNGTQKNEGHEVKVKELNCSETYEFKETTAQYYMIDDKDVDSITLTTIIIPEGGEVTIGHLDCKEDGDNCKVLKLGHKAVPPIPHLHFKAKNKRFKISASPPTAIIKFTCERKCYNVGESNRMMKRIVNGTEAKANPTANEFPFMARLDVIYSSKVEPTCNQNQSTNITKIREQCDGDISPFICGGSIIQTSWILTAQHCVVESEPSVERFFNFGDTDNANKEGLTVDEFYAMLNAFNISIGRSKVEEWFKNASKTEEDDELIDFNEFEQFYDELETLDEELHNAIIQNMRIYIVGVIVTVGDHDTEKLVDEEKNENNIWAAAGKIRRKDNYDPDTYDNDVALLELSSHIVFKEGFRYPICLPPYYWGAKDILKDCDVEAAGWGDTETAIEVTVLMKGSFKVTTDAVCKQEILPETLTENMICTRHIKTNTCSGDSGGPVFLKSDDNYVYEIGIVSFGQLNGTTGKWVKNVPEVNAKVTRYLKWIAGHVENLP